MSSRHDFMDQFLRTGDVSLAVDAGVGVVALTVAYVIIWNTMNRGWGDDRKCLITLGIVGAPLLAIYPDCPFETGKLLRGMFIGSLPAIGWLSFGALVVFAGFAWGYNARKPAALSVAPQTIRAQAEPRPAVSQARATPLPKAAPEPVRLSRLTTPPAVQVEYRRETLLPRARK